MSSNLSIFSKFKKLGLGFLGEDHAIKLIKEEKTKLNLEVNNYLKNKMTEVVLVYMGSGYSLNEKQKKELKANLVALPADEMLQIYNRVLKKGVEISDDVLAYSLVHAAVYIKRYEYDKSRNPIIYLFLEKMNDNVFTKKVLDLWLENLNYLLSKNLDYRVLDLEDGKGSFASNKIVTPFDSFGELIFKNKTLEDFSITMEKLKKLVKKYEKAYEKTKHEFGSDSFKRDLQGTGHELKKMMGTIATYLSSQCEQEIKNKQKKIGVLYDSGELEKLVAAEYTKLMNNNDLQNLPPKAKDIIERIKCDYLSLNKKLADLSDEERFNIENLWEKRIPEILNKYLRAAPEFRETMKNNKGESIEDLLLDSLNNIHDVLSKMQENHTEIMLNDMNVIRHYTKALR